MPPPPAEAAASGVGGVGGLGCGTKGAGVGGNGEGRGLRRGGGGGCIAGEAGPGDVERRELVRERRGHEGGSDPARAGRGTYAESLRALGRGGAVRGCRFQLVCFTCLVVREWRYPCPRDISHTAPADHQTSRATKAHLYDCAFTSLRFFLQGLTIVYTLENPPSTSPTSDLDG